MSPRQEDELKAMFSRHGTVTDVYLPRNSWKTTGGPSIGFGAPLTRNQQHLTARTLAPWRARCAHAHVTTGMSARMIAL